MMEPTTTSGIPRGRSVVLTHFCETHGPSVIFTTQAVPLSSLPPNITLFPIPPKSFTTNQENKEKELVKEAAPTHSATTTPATTPPTSTDTSCTTCRSVADGTALVSAADVESVEDGGEDGREDVGASESTKGSPQDGSPEGGLPSQDQDGPPSPLSSPSSSASSPSKVLVYVSTQRPAAATYALTRTACVRSLSCEVAPRDGPILFSSGSMDGEGLEWGIVSYVFRLADGQARGASRMYSILVMLSDVSLLVNSFAWLAVAMRSIIIDLQSRAKKFSAFPQQLQPLSSNASTPTRSLPRDPSYRRMLRTTPLRPMVELMNDKDFFSKMHVRFCWLIQACINRVGMRMYRIPHVVEDAPTAVHAGTALPLAKIVNYMGLDGFHTVLYNVLVGNQLVIRSDAIELAASIAYSLSLLPPAGCGVSVQHFTQYLHVYAAPILVVPERTVLPVADLDPSSYVLVDIIGADSSQRPVFNVRGVSETTTLGQAIEKVVDDNKTKEDERLALLTSEWQAKAKAYARLRPLCTSATDVKLHTFSKALALAHETADLKVLAFWATGLRQALLVKDVV